MNNIHDAASNKRFNDLDALRAFAMLLGILLHAIFWSLVNEPALSESGPLRLISDFIHGFRMPLFMLLSGFFIAMLWQRRNWVDLVKNRLLRVFLPLVVFTPIIGALLMFAFIPNPDLSLETTLASNDSEQLETFFSEHDINSTGIGGITALQSASFYGNVQSVQWLLDKGANPDISKPDLIFSLKGETALDLARYKGHKEIEALLVKAGAQAITTTEAYKAPPFIGIDFLHLWFLWFLCLLIFGFIITASVLKRFPLPRLPHWLMLTHARYLWLVPLTLVFQSFMPKQWGPETFTSVFVPLHLLAYYAVFFGFGALYYQYCDAFGNDTRHWWLELSIAMVVVLPIGSGLAFSDTAPKMVSDTLSVLYAWLMIFGLIGLFRSKLGGENPIIRYVSDSSYFLYLMHMSVLLLLSSLLIAAPIAIGVKITIMCVVTFVVLLVCYHYLVRYSWLGRWLNGPREKSKDSFLLGQTRSSATD